jgi:mRNA-degrading endonuclease RelE of RelBE toxin-antitoxin system
VTYRVEVASDAAGAFRELAHTHRERVRLRVRALAGAWPCGAVDKVRVRRIRHVDGEFVRVKAGRWVAMCDVIEADEVVVVLGIVSRRDLRWAALGSAGSWRLAVLGRGSASSLIDE